MNKKQNCFNFFSLPIIDFSIENTTSNIDADLLSEAEMNFKKKNDNHVVIVRSHFI